MKKPALHGTPAVVLAALLCLAQPCLAQDGPVFPGFEPSGPMPAPVASEEQLNPPPAPGEPTVIEEPGVEEQSAVEAEMTLPVDNSITPLDESGLPMQGPETQESLRLPAPPPLPVPSGAEANQFGLEGPSLGEERQDHSGNAEPAKKNLWKRSTDALRDLTKPKAEKASPAEEDATRSWQKLRRQTLPQQQGQPQVNQPAQRQMTPQGEPRNGSPQNNSAQQRQMLQQQQLRQQQLLHQQQMQRQMQQRVLQQRQLEQRQHEQQQLQQRQLQQSRIPQNQTPQRYVQPGRASAGAPSAYGNQGNQGQPPSSRRQVQRPLSQPTTGQQRVTVPPSSRSRQPSLPREAKNAPRSPWERS